LGALAKYTAPGGHSETSPGWYQFINPPTARCFNYEHSMGGAIDTLYE
jgi:hypothetical protein